MESLIMGKQQKQSTASVESINEDSQEDLHRQCWESKFWCKTKTCLLVWSGVDFLVSILFLWLLLNRKERVKLENSIFDKCVIVFCVLSLIATIIFSIFGVFKEKLWACSLQVVSEVIQICLVDLTLVIYFILVCSYGDLVPYRPSARPADPYHRLEGDRPIGDTFLVCFFCGGIYTILHVCTLLAARRYAEWIVQKLRGEDLPDDLKDCWTLCYCS